MYTDHSRPPHTPLQAPLEHQKPQLQHAMARQMERTTAQPSIAQPWKSLATEMSCEKQDASFEAEESFCEVVQSNSSISPMWKQSTENWSKKKKNHFVRLESPKWQAFSLDTSFDPSICRGWFPSPVSELPSSDLASPSDTLCFQPAKHLTGFLLSKGPAKGWAVISSTSWDRSL